MQFKISTAVIALAAVAMARPTDPPPASSCNTGELKCCNSTQSAASSPLSSLLGLLGLAVGDITALLGLNCSPLSIVGLSGNSCSAQPVCCTGNTFNGLIAIGCTPININL